MPGDSQEATIGEVCSVGDGAHAKVARQEEGILYLTSKNIGFGSLKLDTVDYISDEDFERLFSKSLRAVNRLIPGDILIGIIGTFGNAYQYKESDHFGISSSIAILRPDPSILDSGFLYYVVTSTAFKDTHAAYKSGSVQGYTNIPTIKSLPIVLPPLAEQKTIAHILGTLDDKIELNQQMNQTLEAIAHALFKSWFIDFDPVRAKLDGRQPAGMDAETAALFPAEFEDGGAIGKIPKGWKIEYLQSITSYLQRGIQPKYLEEDGVLVINQKCIRDHRLNLGYARRHDPGKRSIEGRELKVGDILVNSTGVGTLGRVAQILYLEETAIVDSHVTIVRANPETATLHYLGLTSIEREVEIETLGEGSTGQTELSRTRLGTLKILVPELSIQKQFDFKVSPLREQIVANERQSATLTSIRDALLPKLLSGEIRVQDAETVVEAVT